MFSLSCWKAQATQDLRWWDSCPRLPFIPQRSEGGGTEGSHVPLPGSRAPAYPAPQAYLSVSDSPPRGGSPGKKLLCQTSAWDAAGPPAGLWHSCELSTHHLLALLPRCSHRASRLSQRLRESLGASCDHCHKNRVPWTGFHCCLLSVKRASYVPGPLVSLTVTVQALSPSPQGRTVSCRPSVYVCLMGKSQTCRE